MLGRGRGWAWSWPPLDQARAGLGKGLGAFVLFGAKNLLCNQVITPQPDQRCVSGSLQRPRSGPQPGRKTCVCFSAVL